MVIKILNLTECINKIDKMGLIDLKPEVVEGTRKVQRTAKELVPKKTRYLENSISTEVLSDGIGGYVGKVFTPVEYGPYIEFGTVKMKAQPFMIPALNINRAGIRESMKKYVRDELAKLTK